MLLSPEVTCEHAWSLCYVGSMNVELKGQKRNKGLRPVNKIYASGNCYGQIELFALIKEVFTSVATPIK